MSFDFSGSAYANFLKDGTSDPSIARNVGAFTLAFWVKPDSVAARQTFVSSWPLGTFLCRVDAGGTFQFYANVASMPASTTTGLSVSAGAWQHFAVVYDGAKFRPYKDGTAGTDSAACSGNTANVAAPFEIATSPHDGTNFAGLIGPVAIWTTALSSGDITSLAGGAYPDDVGTGLTFYAPFTSDAEDTINSPDSLTTSLTGSPTYSSDEPPMSSGAVVPVHLLRTQQLGAFAL